MTHGTKAFRKEEEIHTLGLHGGFGESDARCMSLVPVLLPHNCDHQQFARDCSAGHRGMTSPVITLTLAAIDFHLQGWGRIISMQVACQRIDILATLQQQ